MEKEKKNTKTNGKIQKSNNNLNKTNIKSTSAKKSNNSKNTNKKSNVTKNNSSKTNNKKKNSVKTSSKKNSSAKTVNKKNNSKSKNISSNNKNNYKKSNSKKSNSQSTKKTQNSHNKTNLEVNNISTFVDDTNNQKRVENVEEKQIKTIKKEEKNISEDNSKKSKEFVKSKKNVKVWLLILLVFVIIILFLLCLFGINLFSKKIQNNIYIEDINVSKLSIKEAESLLKREYKEVLGKKVKYLYKDKEYNIDLNEIDFKLEINKAIEEAYNLGKDENILEAAKEFYLLKLGKSENIQIDFSYNKEKFKSKIKEFEKSFYAEVKEHTYKIEDNKLIILNGSKGIKINYEEMENEFNLAIDLKSLLKPLDIPVIIDEPQKIDVKKIHDEVYVQVKDAYYTTDPFQIHEEIKGIDFDSLALTNMIKESPEQPEYIIDLVITEPSIKVENLDLYSDELGMCSTSYVNNPNRTVNLRLAASKIDGFILMPGETFSYNDVVGERTVSAGYKNAAIYINGEVEDGLAGGICQISSTLYDAVVYADLEIVERSNHARVPSYLPAGKDATVYWGSKDFKFKNNRSYPIKISMSVGGGYATAVISGKKTDNEYDISIETSVVSRYNGYLVVNAYKVYRQNGEVIKRELLSTDSYKIG